LEGLKAARLGDEDFNTEFTEKGITESGDKITHNVTIKVTISKVKSVEWAL